MRAMLVPHSGAVGYREPTMVPGRDMHAAWDERKGPAREVLVVGEMPTPEPGPGEVRVHLRSSGINPGDTKKRAGWLGFPMSDPRIIPHSDGAGTIDVVGPDVSPERVGE